MRHYPPSTRKDFFRFALGFIGMISLGFVALIAIGAYQVEMSGSKNVSASNPDVFYNP